jgi:predicted O-methyltransferase YrrM
MENVFRDRHYHEYYYPAETVRKLMLHSDTTIQMMDYGMGGKKAKDYQVKVSQIARYSAKGKKNGRLLARISSYFSPAVIVELGTSLGISALYLKAASPSSIVHTIEGSTEVAALARQNFQQAGFSDIHIHTGLFEEVLPNLLKNGLKPDLVFIDGNHNKESTLNYFGGILPSLTPQSILIFDDIHWSKPMEEAWENVQQNPLVRVCIDLYWMGLVFVNTALSKQNYILRI